MPTFYAMVNNDVDINIEVEEFLQEFDDLEIKDIIKFLIRKGHLNDFDISKSSSILEQEHKNFCKKISKSYYRLSNNDCQVIKDISNKL